jgi:hypothetical protein
MSPVIARHAYREDLQIVLCGKYSFDAKAGRGGGSALQHEHQKA